MKKLSLLFLTLLTVLSLSACGNQSHHSKSASTHSSKVAKKHHKKTSKKKTADKHSSSSDNKQNQSSQQTQPQHQSGDQADPFDVSTWSKPYKGYPNFRAYLQDHPNTPNIQSQTAQMQHDENVREGIEDVNGNETQNFKNWEAYRDRAWANGGTPSDYNKNINYSTGQ